jgi:hypothetical protein
MVTDIQFVLLWICCHHCSSLDTVVFAEFQKYSNRFVVALTISEISGDQKGANTKNGILNPILSRVLFRLNKKKIESNLIIVHNNTKIQIVCGSTKTFDFKSSP